MEPTSEFVRDAGEEPESETARRRNVSRTTGWEQVVFDLEDEAVPPIGDGQG